MPENPARTRADPAWTASTRLVKCGRTAVNATRAAPAARTGPGSPSTMVIRPVTPCVMIRKKSTSPPERASSIDSIVFPSFRRSPVRLLFSSAATLAAYPASVTSLVQWVIPAAPSLYRTVAARTASDPKMMPIDAERCSSVNPLSAVCSTPANFDRPMKFPFASYALIPRRSISFCASFDWGVSRCSMLLKEVPASDPTTPAFANAVNPAVVSSIDRPAFAATEPTCFIASVMSRTEPCALPAPAARRSAMWGMSFPDRENWAMAAAAASAASPTSIWPAAARFSAPTSPPDRMSFVDTPALPSSVIDRAASDAENDDVFPISSAASRSWLNSAVVGSR